jgi:hypothetical protein
MDASFRWDDGIETGFLPGILLLVLDLHFRLSSYACDLRNPCFDPKSSPYILVRAFAAMLLTLLRLKVQVVHPCTPVRSSRSSPMAVASGIRKPCRKTIRC